MKTVKKTRQHIKPVLHYILDFTLNYTLNVETMQR